MGTDITFHSAKSILSRASGYISAFDYTLNPYRGCQFGCSYCYAAFFAPSSEQKERWGEWVEAKENAVELLRKAGSRIAGRSIYMSSVTDPYQPIELRLGLVRSLFEVMIPHQPRLVVQTRGPLVVRDIDLLSQFSAVRVNMTITTDDEAVRKTYEPRCASLERRLRAIEQVRDASIRTGICLTPLLPVRDPDAFGRRLQAAAADAYVVQAFQSGNARFAAGTRSEARMLASHCQWGPDEYQSAISVLKEYLPGLREGRDGFMPE